LDNSTTSDTTSTSGGDETNLLTGNHVTSDTRRVTDVLVVSSSVGMLDGVHGNTTNNGPSVLLDSELVVSTSSLQDGLIDTSSTSDDTDHGTAVAGD
jgi:hypothetical protein